MMGTSGLIMAGRFDAPFDGPGYGVLPTVGDAHAVAEEDHVDLAALRDPRGILPHSWVGVVGI